MKHRKIKYSLLFLLLGSCLILSALGFMGRETIYRRYIVDSRTTPYLALVFSGIHDGIYPWELFDTISDPAGNTDDLSLNGTPELSIANDVSGNSAASVSADSTGALLPERSFEQVDKTYFDDAVFIGDSRTDGLMTYGNLKQADFYASVGLSIYDLWTLPFCNVDDNMVTLSETLSQKHYGKIYFQIGINEMGRGTLDAFIKEYEKAITEFHRLQPDAVIFIQGIMKVSKEKSDSDPIFNNLAISERNKRIEALADNRSIFYIDLNEVVCDEEGNLREDLTADQLHLYASRYDIWVDYLLSRGITPAVP